MTLSTARTLATAYATAMLAACGPHIDTVEGPKVLATASPSERYNGQLVAAGSTLIFTSYVYPTATNASIRRISTDGGGVSTIVADQGDIEEITTDGTNVYWLVREPTSFNRTLRRVSIQGGAVTTIASAIPGVALATSKCFATDGTSIYFSSQGHGIRRVPVAGGTITDLAVTAAAESCTLHDGWVYYKNGQFFYRVPTTGGASQTIGGGVSEDPGVELLVIGDNLYGLDFSVLYSLPVTGGEFSPVVLGLQGARDLTSNGQYIYFNDTYSGSVGRVGLSNPIPTRYYSLGISAGMATDDTHIYWIVGGVQLMRGVQ